MPGRGNLENLKKGEKTRFKSGKSAVENGRKGGQAYAAACRKKKAMKERLELLMESPVENKNLKKMIKGMGNPNENPTNYDALVAQMGAQGILKGDVQVIRLILEIMEQMPNMQADINLNGGVTVIDDVPLKDDDND